MSSYPDRLHATLCACDCAVGQSEFCASATLPTGSEHAHRKCDVRVRPYSLRVRRTRTCAERVRPYSRVRRTRTLCALCRAPSFCVAQSLGVSPLSVVFVTKRRSRVSPTRTLGKRLSALLSETGSDDHTPLTASAQCAGDQWSGQRYQDFSFSTHPPGVQGHLKGVLCECHPTYGFGARAQEM
jgi:hypothetical protein